MDMARKLSQMGAEGGHDDVKLANAARLDALTRRVRLESLDDAELEATFGWNAVDAKQLRKQGRLFAFEVPVTHDVRYPRWPFG
jgi:hypothetical protein